MIDTTEKADEFILKLKNANVTFIYLDNRYMEIYSRFNKLMFNLNINNNGILMGWFLSKYLEEDYISISFDTRQHLSIVHLEYTDPFHINNLDKVLKLRSFL